MKNFTFISTLVLLLQFVNAHADGGYLKALANGGYKNALANGGYKNALANGGYKYARDNKSYTCLDFSGDIPEPVTDDNGNIIGVPGVDPGLYLNSDTGTPDACAIIKAAQDEYFPDITLKMFPLDPNNSNVMGPLCFTTKLEGTLGDMPVIAIVNSGIIENYNTTNGFNSFNGVPDTTAATIFTFNKLKKDGTAGRYLGKVYSRDPAFDLPYANDGSNPREYLIVTNGTDLFNKALGSLVIEGDAALGAPIKGKICYLDSHRN